MDLPKFLEFDLALERAADRWRAHIVNSPFSQADHLFDLPFTPAELSSLYAQFGRGSSLPREQTSLSPEDFGRRLYDAVFADKVLSNLESSRKFAKKENRPLHLTLRLSQSPELQNLPWELLHDGIASPHLPQTLACSYIRIVTIRSNLSRHNLKEHP